MRIFETSSALREALAPHGPVVMVPTMGNLHEGHVSLMRAARQYGSTVVATIFVNRLQFRPGEDFDKYPRTFQEDCDQLRKAGVDFLFYPAEREIYPEPQTFFVEVPSRLVADLEGAHRPGHFRGVATVVLKLIHIVEPDRIILGKKDYQQMLILKEMIRELALDVDVVAADTIRADDGLALSSRNGYLTAAQRVEAPRLSHVLIGVAEQIRSGEQNHPRLEQSAIEELSTHGWRVDYVSVRRRADLRLPVPNDNELVVVGAATLGSTRLIDNFEILGRPLAATDPDRAATPRAKVKKTPA